VSPVVGTKSIQLLAVTVSVFASLYWKSHGMVLPSTRVNSLTLVTCKILELAINNCIIDIEREVVYGKYQGICSFEAM